MRSSRITLKDNQQEAALFRRRTVVAVIFVLLMFGVLFARYFYLQVTQYETYSVLSDSNSVHLEAIAPPRGFIYDRNGILLADNQPMFSLTINRQVVPDLEATLAELKPLLELTDEEIERFHAKAKTSRRYEEVPLRTRLSEQDIARMSEVRYRFPGVNVNVSLTRHYPHGELFAHTIGYVGRISEKEQAEIDEAAYAGTNLIGKNGIEKYYEDLLHGKVGYQHVETNAHGRLIRVLKRTPPVRGNDLHLHLDYHLQKIAHDQLAGRRGAVVAMDPKTGGVLAFVSNPSFDPNLFVGGISTKDYAALRDNIDNPLYNRALQGVYPPGSTIKPFSGLGGLHFDNFTWDEAISDPGYFRLPGDSHQFRDWKKTGHGRVDLFKAVEQSCDTYFYILGDRMGVDRFHDWMSQFGFGEKTDIDLVNEKSGTLPSVKWKRERLKAPWYRGEMMSVAIGQGYFTATPIQLAMATAITANKGKHVRPHLLNRTEGLKQFDPVNKPTGLVKFKGTEADWDRMRDAMVAVMHGAGGTARAVGAKAEGYQIAGKTGTAQVRAIKQGAKYDEKAIDQRHWDHGLFVGFAPAHDPKIAVAVIIENGRGGGYVAPIAKALFDYAIHGTYPEVPNSVTTTATPAVAAQSD